jgi:hypothetical protein
MVYSNYRVSRKILTAFSHEVAYWRCQLQGGWELPMTGKSLEVSTVTPAATPEPVFKVFNIPVSDLKASEAISTSRSWEKVHMLIVFGC